MTTRVERIVVGVDGSDSSRQALEWAVGEARLRGAAIEVVLVWEPPYVSRYPYATATFDPGDLERAARVVLDSTVDAVDASGVAVDRVIRCGTAAAGLLAAAKAADLLVVGSRGHGGFTSLLLGSVSQQVAQHAPCPVVIVRAAA